MSTLNNIKTPTSRKMGWMMLFMWAILILAGIIAKRIYQLPELMVFFHLPAALCLVMAFYKLSAKLRARYSEELKKRRYLK